MSELITITSYSEPLEAHIVKGRLEAEGIPTYIANEHHISIAWYLSNALGGVKIQVNKHNQEIAKNIIKSIQTGKFQDELKTEIGELEGNICPNCSSVRFSSKFSFPILALLVACYACSIIFPIHRKKHMCINCNYKWVY